MAIIVPRTGHSSFANFFSSSRALLIDLAWLVTHCALFVFSTWQLENRISNSAFSLLMIGGGSLCYLLRLAYIYYQEKGYIGRPISKTSLVYECAMSTFFILGGVFASQGIFKDFGASVFSIYLVRLVLN